MLDVSYLKENPREAKEKLATRGADVDIERIVELDKKYRKGLHEMESLRAEQNRLTAELSKEQDSNRREELLREASNLKRSVADQDHYVKETKKELDGLLRSLPNIPFDEVPIGEDDSANVVERTEGEKPDFSFKPKGYLEIAAQHDLIDMERAAKVSGSRFGYLTGQAALLEFALVRLALDELVKEGFTPVVPPVMVRREIMENLGYLEKEPDDLYYIEKDDMHLVGTSEQSVVPMFAGETLQAKELPKRFAGFSTCFRREAGSYGKDTRGILRVHQFDKVEMVSFAHPEKSRDEHKFLLEMQERLMQKLELPYQVVKISTGDMGFPTAQQFDIETWVPGEGKYRETHSTSNTTDFQARRLNTRYKGGKEKGFVHILNGTAFAVGRTLIALLENHQQKDGSVKLPKALHEYTGFESISS